MRSTKWFVTFDSYEPNSFTPMSPPEPPDDKAGWRLVGCMSPWPGHVVWAWEREVEES